MSVGKNEALRRLSSLSETLMEHLTKLVVYSDIRPDDIKGWIKTAARCIYQADSITLKPNGRKLKSNDFMSSLFSCMGDELRDYERYLDLFALDNKRGKFNYEGKDSYPDFAVTQELGVTLMTLCYDVIDKTLPLLLDRHDHSLAEYRDIIQNIFDCM